MTRMLDGSPWLAVQANRHSRLSERGSSASGRSYKPRNLAKSVTVE